MKRYNKRGASGRRWVPRLLTATAMLLLFVVVLDIRLRPAIEAIVANQAKLAAFRMINRAMEEELARTDTAYDDLIRLTRGEAGAVTSIQTDVVAVNRLKTGMAESLARALEGADDRTISIPIGTLLGNSFTSGRGPGIEVRLIPTGHIRSELTNQFQSAGINQTLHRVMLHTHVGFTAVLPGYRVQVETETAFCIGETVIVGQIPEGYTIVDGDARDSLTKMYDYKAG